MAKGDLEVKRVGPKSNQSTPHVAVMATTPTASKSAVVVEKNTRGFQKPLKRKYPTNYFLLKNLFLVSLEQSRDSREEI